MEKKYQIFISSTYEDLKDERRKVQDTILSMYHFPIGMEMFSAGNEEQWEIIQETIDSSDYYVLIIGHRYGSVIEKGEFAGISYTQKEFRYALNKKIPVLAFLIDDKVPVTPDKIEDNAVKKQKLKEFKDEVKDGRTVEWWTSPEDLAIRVMNALNKQINRGQMPGWIRADAIDFVKTQKELVEMSRKIRELGEENDALKKNVRVRMPKFLITINDGKEIRIPYQEIDLSKTKNFYLDTLEKEEEQYIRNIQDSDYIDTDMFLPSEKGLTEYQNNYTLHENIKKNYILFQVSCKNIGTGKANDINIDVKIPKEFILLRKTENKKSAIQKKDNITIPSFDYANLANSQVKIYSPYEITEQEDIQDNNLLIRIKDLIHTRIYISDEYKIVATKRGTFEITVSVICEELEAAEFHYIRVIVE